MYTINFQFICRYPCYVLSMYLLGLHYIIDMFSEVQLFGMYSFVHPFPHQALLLSYYARSNEHKHHKLPDSFPFLHQASTSPNFSSHILQ